ncbi:MAG: glycosyltransferase family 39 protein [Pelatocladus maniniholoensis HA4357-MV3]|jgi:4-amino-4-deoxy-L-arabinose transferase-like glycosyltransferase|uniref:Glycosyltransferase family 39 protein n=1 Tax=Pelatocladus maniniholoensis HA4357-MV3 TaxID=1117104 RepID=A0A9E3H8Q5_9NOST|nr:glycosyltransferase family 39 protein [Pelatocladus maniniholoensis HA4357-MV3]
MTIIKSKNILFPSLIISFLIILVIAIRFEPITQTFQFDYDEGFNLMKALLYSKGFSLYSQIWNDQPPLFTVILSNWLKLFSDSIFAARLLTLIFSAVLIWCFYQIIFRELGKFAALVGTILLFTSWLYIRLSISVMIGIPSLALAMLSIYLLKIYKQKTNNLYLILSAGCLALSLQTKLFTVFLIPLILFDLLASDNKLQDIQKNRIVLFKHISLWLIILGSVYSLFGVLYQQFDNQEQLIFTHLKQPQNVEVENFHNLKYLGYMIHQDYDYIFLACIGIWAIISQKKKNGLLPFSWLVTATFILLNHQPLWYHYYPLLAIPICWLAAYGVAFLYDLFFQTLHKDKGFPTINIKKRLLPFSLVVIFISLIIITPPNPRGSVPKNLELMQMVEKYKYFTNWVFTDNPMYAFYNNLLVPPEIAVMSYKRINSGDLTFAKMLAILKKYHPEQIILTRWTTQIKNDKNIMDYINANYSKTYENTAKSEEQYILS